MLRAPRVRELRRGHAVLGALIIGIPASAGVFSAERALADTTAAQPASSGTLTTQVKSHRINYGQDVVVVGSAPSSQAGRQLQLQFAASGSTGSWTTVSSGTVASDGRFRLAAPLTHSGRVSVAARLHVRRHGVKALGLRRVDIRGRLQPGVGGRKVRLEGRSGRSWHTLALARTGAGGSFDLHYTPSSVGRQALRVRFRGDSANAWTSAGAGSVTVFHQTVVSWYNDGGYTGCGFHAYYGVANKTLPCGTKVTFTNGGRTVTATVDDRGPYVGGRDWDLNENTAAALGFGGVGTVWSSL
jgi:hypothetical protein